MREVSIPASVKDTLTEWFWQSEPNECCGVLLGRIYGDSIYVSKAIPCRNSEASPSSFSIEASAIALTKRIAKEEGLEVLGYFHSHPLGSDTPSAADYSIMSIGTDLWLLLSRGSDQGLHIRAFVSDQGIPIQQDNKVV